LRLLSTNGFAGPIYPVNPKYPELFGMACYPSLADLPTPVDVVLSFAQAQMTPEVVRHAGRAGAAAVIVFASGFAETGSAGQTLQDELLAAAREAGIRMLGPNSIGLINRDHGLFATFSPAAERALPPAARVAYVGQSGAIGGSLLDLANDIGLGLSMWAATGNQADLDIVELAAHFIDDSTIDVLLMYAEGISDGARFVELARRARVRGTTIVLLRSGLSAAGRRAAQSHTGAMLGDDAAVVATARRFGMVVVDDLRELLLVGATLAAHPRPRGPRLAVVTTSGGAGILVADQCEAHGVQMAELEPRTVATIERIIPPFGAAGNPVDVTAQILNTAESTSDMRRVLLALAADPGVDAMTVVLTMVTGPKGADLAEMFAAIRAETGKPIWIQWLASRELTDEARKILRRHGIPVFGSPAELARVAALVVQRPVIVEPATPEPSDELRAAIRDLVAQPDAGWAILDRLGVARPRSIRCATALEATAAAGRLGASVVMKIESRDLAHKSDIGGVAVGVPTADVASVHETLMRRARDAGLSDAATLVQEMIPTGVELIIGAVSTGDGFPPLITVGLGGVTAEIYRDVATSTAPVAVTEAHSMLRSLRAWPLLDGYRGRLRCDVDAAARAVSRVSDMIATLGDLPVEFEINPLIVGAAGATAVDVLVRRHP
jgi:acyl-CoA synthetase (NDP forming)